MQLTQAQVEKFDQDGYLMIEALFTQEEIESLMREILWEFAVDSPRHIKERSGGVRSVFALHFTNETFRCLTRLPRLVEPARQLLGSEVYVHQFKVNAKVALEGDQWEWHQDFLYWHKEDGMPAPRVLTAAVFLQEVNDFNGPMLIIPGSHREGMIDVEAQAAMNGADELHAAKNAGSGSSWIHTLTADLKYKIDRRILARLLAKKRIYAAKGQAGFVLFFHGNLFHASANNLSPDDRMSVFVTYNSVENTLIEVARPRPAFIASRDFTPIATASDDALLGLSREPRRQPQEQWSKAGEIT
jgi:ectoine hydroxylase